MAIISPSTFDPLNRYVAVRLQQGVPIVDADWNEQEDVRKFELRTYLKWFVGDGVPDGNDGFLCVANNTVSDFVISRGVPAAPGGATSIERALGHVGRIITDGLDAIIPDDRLFRSQPLHVSQGTAAALSAAWGVPTVPELPLIDRLITLYVDVWDRLVTSAEDPALIFPGLGTESCARHRREWVVRWRDSATLSAPRRGDGDWLAGHAYYVLALVTRRTTSGTVFAEDLIDRRERRLFTLPAFLTEDLFGVEAHTYRRGDDRPPIDLRAAINALLADELPMTDELALIAGNDRQFMRRGVFFEGTSLIALAHTEVGGLGNIDFWRIDLATRTVTATYPIITGGPVPAPWPEACRLPNGEYIVVYPSNATGEIVYKRGKPADLAAATPQVIATNSLPGISLPVPLLAGNIVSFVYYATGSLINVRRLRHTDSVWIDAAPVALTTGAARLEFSGQLVAADGMIWIVYCPQPTGDLQWFRFDPTSVPLATPVSAAVSAGVQGTWSFLFQRASGDLMLLSPVTGGGATVGINEGVWNGASWTVTPLPTTAAPVGSFYPSAVEDASGAVWVYYNPTSFSGTISVARRNPATGAWAAARPVVSTGGTFEGIPFAKKAPNGVHWMFWLSDREAPGGGFGKVFYKTIVTRL
jgi:hypothetical protein